MLAVSLNTTMVLPVGVPVTALNASEGWAGANVDVGTSEHATTTAARVSAPSENRPANFHGWCIEFLDTELCMRVVRAPEWDRSTYVVDAKNARWASEFSERHRLPKKDGRAERRKLGELLI
jgi:hypothetical protein